VLLKSIKNANDINILQNDLYSVDNYCRENELKLNAQKTKHLRIELKNSNFCGHILNDICINSVESHKHLGITYDEKMCFNNHCNDFASKAFSKFNLLKHICHNVNGNIFLKLYKSYILPIVEYSNLCYTPTITQSTKLEKVQKRITKFICFKLGKHNLKYDERLKILNLKTLKYRREMSTLKVIHNTIYKHKSIPDKWLSQLNLYESSRNGRFLSILFIRIKFIKKFFLDMEQTFLIVCQFLFEMNVILKYL
jgi:hypothetical protein